MDTPTPVKDIAVDVLRAHEWVRAKAACRCGWTQRESLGRRHAGFNHPHHVADRLQAVGLLREA